MLLFPTENKFSYVRIPVGEIELPYFKATIADKLEKKIHLDKDDFSFICRQIAQRIEQITVHPHPEVMRTFAEKFIKAFPYLYKEETDAHRLIVTI